MRYVLVAFKVKEEKSVYYGRAWSLEGVAVMLERAFNKFGAEFASIRAIPEETKKEAKNGKVASDGAS